MQSLNRRRTARSAAAFTLIEILAVVTILGIASAIIVPQIATRDDLQAAAAARAVMADLIYAQNRAITMQTPHYVQFVTNGYTICAKASDGTIKPIKNPVTQQDYTVTFGAGNLADLTLGAVTFDNNKGTLAYDELGIPNVTDSPGLPCARMNANGSIAVTCGTFTMTIAVESYTGELSVQ
jgi:prepilin-type N-terminal cleavage/methylation domain-containing protein